MSFLRAHIRFQNFRKLGNRFQKLAGFKENLFRDFELVNYFSKMTVRKWYERKLVILDRKSQTDYKNLDKDLQNELMEEKMYYSFTLLEAFKGEYNLTYLGKDISNNLENIISWE